MNQPIYRNTKVVKGSHNRVKLQEISKNAKIKLEKGLENLRTICFDKRRPYDKLVALQQHKSQMGHHGAFHKDPALHHLLKRFVSKTIRF